MKQLRFMKKFILTDMVISPGFLAAFDQNRFSLLSVQQSLYKKFLDCNTLTGNKIQGKICNTKTTFSKAFSNQISPLQDRKDRKLMGIIYICALSYPQEGQYLVVSSIVCMQFTQILFTSIMLPIVSPLLYQKQLSAVGNSIISQTSFRGKNLFASHVAET